MAGIITLATVHATYVALDKDWFCSVSFAVLNEDCLLDIFPAEAGLHRHKSFCMLHKVPSCHNHLLKDKQTKNHDME